MGKKPRFKLLKPKEGINMNIQPVVSEDSQNEDNQHLTCLSNARRIVQKTMKEKGLSKEQVRQSFKDIRYEK